MKGGSYIFSLMVIVAIVLIFLLIAIPFLSKAKTDFQERGEPKLKEIVEYVEGYKFNEEDLFVNPDDIETGFQYFEDKNSEDLTLFCADFHDAFIESVSSNGEPVLIKELDVVLDDSKSAESLFKQYTACGGMEIIKKEGDIEREICTLNSNFDYITSLIYTQEDSGSFRTYDPITPYENVPTEYYWNNLYRISANNYDPYIHGCYIPTTFNNPTSISNLLIQPNMNFQIPSNDPASTTHLYDKNGGYSLRIVLTDANIGENGKCVYNLFICMQPSIGKNSNDVNYEIFKHFRYTITDDMECCKDCDEAYMNKGYSRPYIFDFTNQVDKPNLYEVMAAIDAGMWEWSKANYNNKNLISQLSKNAPNIPISDYMKNLLKKDSRFKYWWDSDYPPDHIRFAYRPHSFYKHRVMVPFTNSQESNNGWVYPNCVIWSDYTNYLIDGAFTNIYYSKAWEDPYDTNYDKLSITTTFVYEIVKVWEITEKNKLGSVEEQIIAVVPYISICRDK